MLMEFHSALSIQKIEAERVGSISGGILDLHLFVERTHSYRVRSGLRRALIYEPYYVLVLHNQFFSVYPQHPSVSGNHAGTACQSACPLIAGVREHASLNMLFQISPL